MSVLMSASAKSPLHKELIEMAGYARASAMSTQMAMHRI